VAGNSQELELVEFDLNWRSRLYVKASLLSAMVGCDSSGWSGRLKERNLMYL